MKYVKKPVPVEALPYSPENLKEVLQFVGEYGYYVDAFKKLRLHTRNGEVTAKPGDMIIRGQGECYPCPIDVFESTYVEYAIKKVTEVPKVKLIIPEPDEIKKEIERIEASLPHQIVERYRRYLDGND